MSKCEPFSPFFVLSVSLMRERTRVSPFLSARTATATLCCACVGSLIANQIRTCTVVGLPVDWLASCFPCHVPTHFCPHTHAHAMAPRERRVAPHSNDDDDALASGAQYLRLNLQYPGLRKVHESPPIYFCDHFLSDHQCDALMEAAEPNLEPSKTLPLIKKGISASLTRLRMRMVFGASGADRGRTSFTCSLNKDESGGPACWLLDKVQHLTGAPIEHMESPQVARYANTQCYTWHYDTPRGTEGREAARFCANGGSRVATVLIYLNHVQEGGATAFRPWWAWRSRYEARPVRGGALVFFPAFVGTGKQDRRARHAALPARDTKWVSQVWVRQHHWSSTSLIT